MPRYIVRQPNGKFAEFSTVVDDFTALDMTAHEAFEVCRPKMSDIDACLKVLRGVDDCSRDAKAVPGSGLDRWNDCIETIRLLHGDKELERLRAEYPDIFKAKGE